MSTDAFRRATFACFVALIALGVVWETRLAPLRPGAWLLALKVAPLVLALPGIARGHLRSYQWWSMLILVYLAEGTVRALSDPPPGALLAALEAVLAALAFGFILLHVRSARRPT